MSGLTGPGAATLLEQSQARLAEALSKVPPDAKGVVVVSGRYVDGKPGGEVAVVDRINDEWAVGVWAAYNGKVSAGFDVVHVWGAKK